MRLASFSLWLGCLASSTLAFSSLSKPTIPGRAVSASQGNTHTTTALGVASADPVAVANMERGVGGRIEAAFEAAKTKGEAAFVTFITAGYPNAQGTTMGIMEECYDLPLGLDLPTLSPFLFSRYPCFVDGNAGGWRFDY